MEVMRRITNARAISENSHGIKNNEIKARTNHSTETRLISGFICLLVASFYVVYIGNSFHHPVSYSKIKQNVHLSKIISNPTALSSPTSINENDNVSDINNSNCDPNNDSEATASLERSLPSILEAARLARSLTTIPKWETLTIPVGPEMTKKSISSTFDSSIPIYSIDVSDLIDRVFALLLIRVLAIIYDRSDVNSDIFLPTFSDLSTSTICHTLLTATNHNIQVKEDWKWPKSMTHEFMHQLKNYVTNIISVHHNDVPYHNYKHAYNVFVSANKLLDLLLYENEYNFYAASEHVSQSEKYDKRSLYPLKYGIDKDYFLQFSVLFSALIHDVDHRGLTNSQLIQAGDDLTLKYSNNRSVLERNSLSVAFTLLDKPCYGALRSLLFVIDDGTEAREVLHRDWSYAQFQSVVTDLVLSTDIAGSKTFETQEEQQTDLLDHFKAIENLKLLLQAADISPVLQSWDAFILSSHKLFEEQKRAFYLKYGEDPAPGWFKNQISFLEKHSIPFARKLRQTAVFEDRIGKTFVDNAKRNLEQWLAKGAEITNKMISCDDG